MFSYFLISWFVEDDVLCFLFVLKEAVINFQIFDMIHFSCFEISTATLISAALWSFEIKQALGSLIEEIQNIITCRSSFAFLNLKSSARSQKKERGFCSMT